ncbi:Gfo/Idh/MocA family protein [Polaromonas jejuensis]|uniref:Gfo/Idh/MocA family protein n=1 Tax=Polaromonas jejuensis TaxID=457502 RepID=A0ABW0Q564_9BURK|nr:Gfo/Idh/MocA family oxidoreductase [Polaromonas jejuensis]
MKKTINWGVLGAAAIATGRTMPALNEAPSATLLALASRDGAKGRAAAEALGVPRVYASYDELLADPDIDAVYVPLPNQLHLEWSVRALEAGKHVLCEKPLCLTAAQVTQLCAVRDRSGLHIEEGFSFRNHPQWAKLDDLLASNAIGPVRAVHATLAKQFLDPADVRNNPAAGGGALYDLGSYAISACNLIFKRQPTRVVAALEHDPAFGIDRLSSALLDYGDRHAAFTVATQAGPSSWGSHQQLSVLGATGWLRLDFPYAHGRPSACRIELGDATSVGSFPTETFTFEPVNQYTLQVERFSRLLLGHQEASWPIEDALGTLRTIEALFESGRSGAWQVLPRP